MKNLENGFEIVDNFIDNNQIEKILKELSTAEYSRNTGGIRNAEKKFGTIKNYTQSQQLLERVGQYFHTKPLFIRAILFNKSSENNWLVTWHQDKTVAVSKRFEKPGWNIWSTKDNVEHVQPPLEVLNQMVTFRVHLDEALQENGCLKVIPNSHKRGILAQTEIQLYCRDTPSLTCEAKRGSALVMRPHILHSSGKATHPSQRRTLHLEFSDYPLPRDIHWG